MILTLIRDSNFSFQVLILTYDLDNFLRLKDRTRLHFSNFQSTLIICS